MVLFDAFRGIPAPALYDEIRNPVMGDVIVVGLLVAFAMIMASFVIGILPGVAGGLMKKLSVFVRALFASFVGASILVCLFGDGWMVDEVTTYVYLKQFSTTEAHAEVGFHIGLRGMNITLKGKPEYQSFEGNSTEQINYNEHYEFGQLQGRLGFGPQAGIVSQEFRYAQLRGAPLPILWILEYFTLDGEDIRWGRNFRQAGYYCNLLMWSSFAFWILSILLFTTAIASACFLLGITGLLQIIGAGVYAGMRDQHGPPLIIPIAQGALMEPHYGWSFILTLFTGILCVLTATVIYYMYLRYPELLYEFFDNDLLEEEDYLEVQRTIDDKDGYANTWDKQDQQQQQGGISASGDIVKVPLTGGVGANGSSGTGAAGDPEAGKADEATYLRKSRRSKRVRNKASSKRNQARPNLGAVTEEEEEGGAAGQNGDMEMRTVNKVSLSDALRSSIKRKKKEQPEEETAINEAMEGAEETDSRGQPEEV
ncbi:dual oxidase maturation factor 1-like [Sycon ciliatum]|uniref:dual oxidase maturation factor 1-like n=1 Tax=Sycon ciliatum TaxID=27933 RepID=UPI0020AE4636|eukprot:scpid48849/ scgid25644/ Dual oxidase maturation factor 1; Dual oxidase activator 1